MNAALLGDVLARNRAGERLALPSFCTANRLALDAIFDFAAARQLPVLVEATCNQVNQFGGYSGMRAPDYLTFVGTVARERGYDPGEVLFGGDHLGPNPWKGDAPDVALSKAAELVGSYARAGFVKIHLDASMGCAGEGVPSPTEIAERSAALCLAAEREAGAEAPPVYVIGTEVPTPGGETDDMDGLAVTDVSNVAETVGTHRDAFFERGLEAAWGRTVAIVTQPGVDFSHSSVHPFEPGAATALSRAILDHPGMAFEAHSTDYQAPQALCDLVASHYVFLKVGPELTFAVREAIVLLGLVEAHLVEPDDQSRVVDAVITAMDDDPRYWQDYYAGDERSIAVQKLFSYSDRIRYYWGVGRVSRAVEKLFANLERAAIPETLISQYFPRHTEESRAVRSAELPRFLLRRHVQGVVAKYYAACGLGS